jgi:hypothetical protein
MSFLKQQLEFGLVLYYKYSPKHCYRRHPSHFHALAGWLVVKNEKTRGERGAYSHYILVMAVSYSVVLYVWHCVFRIALALRVIDGRNLYTATREVSPALSSYPLPQFIWHRLSNKRVADIAL